MNSLGSLNQAELLTQILDSNVVDASTSADNTAVKVLKDDYHKLVAYGNVTSYSIQKEYSRCRRRFEIIKLGADLRTRNNTAELVAAVENVDFAFGHAVGAGVATYDESHSLTQAIFQAFLAWNIDFSAEKPKPVRGTDPKKSLAYAIWAVQLYASFYAEETDLSEYQVVKNEARVCIDFENGHYYVGHIDTLLKHRDSGRFRIKENKTTSFGAVHPALYANSEQALSYSVVIDSLGESEYDVLYTVYSTSEQRWMQFPFVKSRTAKAEWIQSQYLLHADIDGSCSVGGGFFPKNGDGCLKFNRPCEYYGTCDMSRKTMFGKSYNDLGRIQSLEELTSLMPFDYVYKISDVIKGQQR